MVFYKRNRTGKFLSGAKSSVRKKQIAFEHVLPDNKTDINSDGTHPIVISDTLNGDDKCCILCCKFNTIECN